MYVNTVGLDTVIVVSPAVMVVGVFTVVETVEVLMLPLQVGVKGIWYTVGVELVARVGVKVGVKLELIELEG